MNRFIFILFLLAVLPWAGARAQSVPAMPVAKVAVETLPITNGPVMLELFTSKTCAFCPQADALFAELVKQPNVIGIACHVDYLQNSDPLAQDFCKSRQQWYMSRLHAGPSYTPQLVINGADETIGYKTDRVTELVKRAAAQGVQPVGIEDIVSTAAPGDYQITLPDDVISAGLKGWMLTVITFKKPVQTPAGPGYQGGTAMRVADGMQVLPLDNYKGSGFKLSVPMTDAQEGFTVVLQKQDTGKIAAAGQFLKAEDQAVR